MPYVPPEHQNNDRAPASHKTLENYKLRT